MGRCDQEKDAKDFYWKRGKPDGWCKACYRNWYLERHPLKVPVPKHITCELCGEKYTPKQRRPTKYCSQYCRNQARIRADRERRRLRAESLRCEWCGGGIAFVPGRRGKTKFCSKKCQIAGLNARRTPEERSAYRFLRKYGITLEQRDDLLKKQGGGCAICQTQDPGEKGWALDHDHACCSSTENERTCGKCVRGVLCNRCNLALGLFDDDLERLRKAIRYLT